MKRKRDRELQEKILETLEEIKNLITLFYCGFVNFMEHTETYQQQVLQDLKENE